MGVDLARRARAAFQKALDRHLVDLAAGNLLSRAIPPGMVRSAAGDVSRGTVLAVGEEMVVQFVGGRFVGLKGIDEVACFPEAEAGWADPLRAGNAAIKGVVEAVHDLGDGVAVAEVRMECP